MNAAAILAFDLDADVAVTDLRSEDLLAGRLRAHPALRVRRRNDVLGVLVTPEHWRAIADHVLHLEQLVDGYENAAVEQMISRRAAGAEFVQAGSDAWKEVTQHLTRLGSE